MMNSCSSSRKPAAVFRACLVAIFVAGCSSDAEQGDACEDEERPQVPGAPQEAVIQSQFKLENRVKRAVIMSDGKLVGAEDLDLGGDEEAGELALNLKQAREEADRRMIRKALSRTQGNISNTAKLLGISRPTLYDLLKQYDLQD